MIVDLVRISSEEIVQSAQSFSSKDNMVVMYLQNSGDPEHYWNNSKFQTLIDEDIDD